MGEGDLINDIQNRYKTKAGYKNKHKQKQKIIASKYNVKRADEYIDVRVDNIYSDITDKYKLEEKEIYDRLYLKVRKLFLEMM